MPEGRPAIPRPMRRDLEVEAGSRCAIPTCRSVPIEFAHIDPWEKVREHAFDNLIVLCPTCHARYDRGDIDRLTMLRYKANLTVLSNRYGDVEQRLLKGLADHPDAIVEILGGLDILVMYLLMDGLIERIVIQQDVQVTITGYQENQHYRLTEKGRAFIARWMAADPLQ